MVGSSSSSDEDGDKRPCKRQRGVPPADDEWMYHPTSSNTPHTTTATTSNALFRPSGDHYDVEQPQFPFTAEEAEDINQLTVDQGVPGNLLDVGIVVTHPTESRVPMQSPVLLHLAGDLPNVEPILSSNTEEVYITVPRPRIQDFDEFGRIIGRRFPECEHCWQVFQRQHLLSAHQPSCGYIVPYSVAPVVP